MVLRSTLLVVLLNLGLGFQIPKPSLSGDLVLNTRYEHNSDPDRQRRPAAGYCLGFNTLLSLLFFNADLNLLYDSDDHFTAQKINQFNLDLNPNMPSWKWIKLRLGDFSSALSEFTLSGIPISGAGLELAPGHWRFTLLTGRSKRAVLDSLNWSYNRTISALRLGSEYLSLVVMKATDDTSSLQLSDSVVPIPPQENLVLCLTSNFTVTKMLALDMEGASSVHTRDLRNDTFHLAGLPGFAYSLYTPRHSSHIDFALRGTLKFTMKFALLSVGFQEVGPGFTSLGLPYIKNDQRKWNLGLAIKKIPKTDIRIGIETESDNLIKNRLATTRSNDLHFALVFYPLPALNFAGNYDQKNTQKDVPNDSFMLNSSFRTFSLTPNLYFGFSGVYQNLMVVLGHQDYADRNRVSETPASRTLSVGINYSITPKIPVTFSTGFSQTYDLSPATQSVPVNYHNYGITANRALLNNRLNNSITFCYQPSTAGSNYSCTGNHSYAFAQKNALNLEWYLGLFSSTEQAVNDFNLQMVKFSYNRRI